MEGFSLFIQSNFSSFDLGPPSNGIGTRFFRWNLKTLGQF